MTERGWPRGRIVLPQICVNWLCFTAVDHNELMLLEYLWVSVRSGWFLTTFLCWGRQLWQRRPNKQTCTATNWFQQEIYRIKRSSLIVFDVVWRKKVHNFEILSSCRIKEKSGLNVSFLSKVKKQALLGDNRVVKIVQPLLSNWQSKMIHWSLVIMKQGKLNG